MPLNEDIYEIYDLFISHFLYILYQNFSLFSIKVTYGVDRGERGR